MKIIDLVKLCKCTRKQILKDVDLVVSYTLIKILMDDNDNIPGVGNAKLVLELDNNKYFLNIELDNKWQDLLHDRGVDKVLTNKLIELAKDGGLDYNISV